MFRAMVGKTRHRNENSAIQFSRDEYPATRITRNARNANSLANNYISTSCRKLLSLGSVWPPVSRYKYVYTYVLIFLHRLRPISERDHFSRLREDEKSFNVARIGDEEKGKERDSEPVFRRL